MSMTEEPRKPRAFDPHDPSIVEEPSAPAEPEAVVGEAAAPLADEKGTSRPTLAAVVALALLSCDESR